MTEREQQINALLERAARLVGDPDGTSSPRWERNVDIANVCVASAQVLALLAINDTLEQKP